MAGLFATTLVHAQTYYLQSLGGVGSVPYPINPYGDSVSVEEVSTGIYLIEDGSGDRSRFHAMDDFSLPSPDDGSGTNEIQSDYTSPSYTTNDLWLSITSASNGISQIIIHPPWNDDVSTDSWNLFYTTNLVTPFTNWWWILTTDIGQTNLAVANATDINGFYALGIVTNSADRPPASGDNFPMCPNTTNSITLFPSTYPSYTILTHPTNGVLSGTAPNLTYTPNPCFEDGQDSFIYKANDGTNDSAPATVNITIYPDSLFSYAVLAQTCRGMKVGFYLIGGNCANTVNYMVSTPSDGTVTNLSGSPADPYYIYTPNDTNFTGTNIFNYIVYDDCGAVTNIVTVTIGDANLNATPQSVMTGTNRPVSITLQSSDDIDSCNADTNYYAYAIISSPTNGTLTGMPPNLSYSPNTNYEGLDSFQFVVSEGVWTSTPAIDILYVVAGPVLFTECDPFGPAAELEWSLDANVQTMVDEDNLHIIDFIIFRSTNSGGPYTAIYTNAASQMNYFDTNTGPGQTNYYVVNFESLESRIIYESPDSNETAATGKNPNNLISADAVWDVATNLSAPNSTVKMRAPFSSEYPDQYVNLYPPPNTNWPVGTTWTNHITMVVPSNSVPLAQVQYSIAIDNIYWLYVNGAYVGSADNNGGVAAWSPFQSFPTNVLHFGTNNIVVGIEDLGDVNYFSMVVTTNTCGQ